MLTVRRTFSNSLAASATRHDLLKGDTVNSPCWCEATRDFRDYRDYLYGFLECSRSGERARWKSTPASTWNSPQVPCANLIRRSWRSLSIPTRTICPLIDEGQF